MPFTLGQWRWYAAKQQQDHRRETQGYQDVIPDTSEPSTDDLQPDINEPQDPS